MKTGQLKDYAPQARRDFIAAVTDRAAFYGLTAHEIVGVQEKGDVAIIAGRPFPRSVAVKRKKLEEQIRQHGFEQVIEKVAYTWFNRLVAIRFMELHGYLDHGYRVLSHPEGKPLPEIVEHAEHVQLPGLDQAKVVELKLDGNRESELYRLLLVAQCNALSRAMPFLFESIDDETELLLPDNLLHSDSLIRTLAESIAEEDWKEGIEIVGWLYQFYISEKKAEVIGKVVKSEDIPAATQLFTPNWIVKYMVQNSLGRQWVATYPQSALKAQMEYYIEPAEQTPEVQAKLREITPTSLNPEELTLLDPACGSGHILVEAYDLLKAIYQERGYRAKDIPRLILEKNLFGLEIDDRAAQLAAFALMMKARADDRRIFDSSVQPHVLAIQESKGLDANEITDALNAPILKETAPPSGHLFEEIADEESPLFSRKNLSVKGEISQADIAHLIQLFEHGKTFGSLIRIPEKLAERLPAIAQRVEDVLKHGGMLEQAVVGLLNSFATAARILAHHYDVVVTNPPYLGNKGMNSLLKSFAKNNYQDFKADTFAMFIARALELGKPRGFAGLMTPFVWMFIGTYRSLRTLLVEKKTIHSLVHPEYHAFFDSAYVPLCTFVASNLHTREPGHYFDLRQFYGAELQPVKLLEAIHNTQCKWRYLVCSEEFASVPDEPIVYWLPSSLRSVFRQGVPLEQLAEPRIGMATCDNATFLRLWSEVSIDRIGFGCKSRFEAIESGRKWFPHHKGGAFRRWYGNLEYVVDWENDGFLLQNTKHPTDDRIRAHNFNLEYIFKPALVWTSVTSASPSFRLSDHGFLYDAASGLCPVKNPDNAFLILGLLNSSLVKELQPALNPTLNLVPGDLCRVPIVRGAECPRISSIVHRLVEVSQLDWDLAETAWGFQQSPLLSVKVMAESLRSSVKKFQDDCTNRIAEARVLEEENNRLILAMYQLEKELPSNVPDEEIMLYRSSDQEEVCRLISYAIGCMMGRYSLDKAGLIHANSGNNGFDASHYKTFPADRDGIIPLTDFEWFEDDTAKRFEEFIAVAWPKEHLEENLKFVADSLGPKSGESSRDTIRRYLATGFYKHHLSMYKRRPIYWLFSSGKQRAFQTLVYLHRYNEGTLSRMRTEYVVPLLGKISARIGHLDQDITGATGKHRRDLEKEQATLRKQLAELQEYDDKLRNYTDQRIALDLDDGVKVNYAKFGDLLAEVKAVTGGSDEE